MAHCPGCDGTSDIREYYPGGPEPKLCPGVQCASCVEKDAEIAKLTTELGVLVDEVNRLDGGQVKMLEIANENLARERDAAQVEVDRLKENDSDLTMMVNKYLSGLNATCNNGSTVLNDSLDAKVRWLAAELILRIEILIDLREGIAKLQANNARLVSMREP